MSKKAYFFKKVKNIRELEEKTKRALVNKEKAQKYVVIETCSLSDFDFFKFTHSLDESHCFIKNISHKLTMNADAEYLCISVTSNNSDLEILVNSSGYSYARLVALVLKGK